MHMHTNNGITVFAEAGPIEVPAHSLKYQLIINAINSNASQEEIEEIANQSENQTVADFSSGRVSYENGILTAKGIDIPESVVNRVRRIIEAGITNIKPWVYFLDKLIDNPSRASVVELYDWLEYQGLPLAQDGDVLGYKSVDSNYYSHTAGMTPLLSGNVDNGKVLNSVGSVIEMARNQVDDNRDNGCSYGLHIGNYEYATNFGGGDSRLVVVKFNPSDAVSVPHCSSHQKLRVAKYTVIKDITNTKTFLDQHLYNIENGELHAQTTDSEQRIIEGISRTMDEFPDHDINFINISEEWNVTPDKLVKILHKHGYCVDWSDTSVPKIVLDEAAYSELPTNY